MIDAGHDLDTVAVSAVLIAYNWPRESDRYRRIAKFVERFFPRLADFQKPPHHPKWRETNLAAVLPGWNRFPAAAEWIEDNRAKVPVATDTRQQFERFLATRAASGAQRPAGNIQAREQLFQEFLKWQAHERP
jgi:hypothetical protein